MQLVQLIPALRFAVVLAFCASAPAFAQTEVLYVPGAAGGDQSGWSTASVGDVDNDGKPDFAIGAPYADIPASNAGSVTVYSGQTQQVLYTWMGAAGGNKFGTSVSAAGDVDLDGHDDVLVGAPGGDHVRLHSGATGTVLHTFAGLAGSGLGTSVSGGSDIDGDQVPDVVVGAPFDSTAATNAGAVRVYSGFFGAPIRAHFGAIQYQNLGQAVLLHGDVDGDNRGDYAAGSPAPVIGGPFQPTIVEMFSGAAGGLLWTSPPGFWNDMFGWSLASLADITGDGVGEVLAGGPQDPGVGCGCNGFGYVRLLDGVSGAQVYQVSGTNGYSGLGWALTGIGDITGNGYDDFAASQPGTGGCGGNTKPVQILEGLSGALLFSLPVASGQGTQFGFSLASADATGDGLRDLLVGTPCESPAGTYSGAVHVYTFVRNPSIYCDTQVNSLGCSPFIATAGTPSATQPVAFRIKAFQVLSSKIGILIYGFKPQQVPFLGGNLCLASPIKRTPGQNSGGSFPPTSCSGVFSIDFNERIRSGVDPLLIAGEEVYSQYWSRDGGAVNGSNLTNAVGFYINP